MSLFSRLWNHVRSADLSREIDREVAFHIAERADDLVASGMSADDAQHEARRRFGNVSLQKERTRERDLFSWLDDAIADLRYAIRSFRAAPAFSAVAILSLALGIGANTAIFGIFSAVMLKSLPVNHPEQLVALNRGEHAQPYGDIETDPNGYAFTNPLWEAIRDRQDEFAGLFAVSDARFNLTDGGEARRIDANLVSGEYFSTLGVGAAAGRLLTPADDFRGCPGVAVLSDGFWRSELGADPKAIGRTISFNGHPFTIVGVANARFSGVNVGRHPKAFVPLCANEILHGPKTLDNRSDWYLQIIGRPRPNLTSARLSARLAALAPSIIEATIPPDWPAADLAEYRKATLDATPAATGFSDLRSTYTKALYVLMAIVGLVLLIACANVANLLLARATARRREIALRLALGAGRGRIVRQLVTESLLLSTLGAVTGVAFAAFGSHALVGFLSGNDGRIALDTSIDARMLLFTASVAILTGLLFGLAPAWQQRHVAPQAAMMSQGRGLAEGHSRFSMAKTLVAAQVALSLALVAAAVLLLGSWRKLATIDPGFRSRNVLLVAASLRSDNPTPERTAVLVQQMLERLRAVPGLRSASVSVTTPVGSSTWNSKLHVDGGRADAERDPLTWVNAVSDGYFATLGIPLLAGRDFGEDEAPASHIAIVNVAMAQKFFGTENVLGRTFQPLEGADSSARYQIVGVVGDTKYRSLRDSTPSIVYYPHSQARVNYPMENFELYADNPLVLIPSVKAAIAEVSPRAVLDFRTLDRQLDDSMRLMRTVASLSGVVGGLALVLAMIGLYGVMTYTVARRRNEIGVRIALGAARASIIRMVLSDVTRIVVGGVVIGVWLTFAVTRLVTTFLYGLGPNDPLTLFGSAILLVAVGMVAAAIPARRAARLDPVAALREE